MIEGAPKTERKLRPPPVAVLLETLDGISVASGTVDPGNYPMWIERPLRASARVDTGDAIMTESYPCRRYELLGHETVRGVRYVVYREVCK